MKKTLVLVVAAAVAAVVAVGAGVWLLVGGGDAEASERGSCGQASYTLSAEREDGGVDVGLELQSAAPGESWTVALEQGGTVLVEGQRMTDEDAELDLDSFVRDAADDLELVATMSPESGDDCTARVTV